MTREAPASTRQSWDQHGQVTSAFPSFLPVLTQFFIQSLTQMPLPSRSSPNLSGIIIHSSLAEPLFVSVMSNETFRGGRGIWVGGWEGLHPLPHYCAEVSLPVLAPDKPSSGKPKDLFHVLEYQLLMKIFHLKPPLAFLLRKSHSWVASHKKLCVVCRETDSKMATGTITCIRKRGWGAAV